MKHNTYLFDGMKAQSLDNLDEWMDKQLETGGDAHGLYAAVPWVYRCIRLRANAVSSVPYVIRKGKEPTEYPLAYMLPALFWRTEASMCIYGAAYWLKEQNRARVMGARWLLPPSITIESNETQGLTGFKRTLGAGKVIQYKPEDLVYFWEPSLSSEVGPGVPPSKSALADAGMARYATEFASAFFERGAIPATLLTVEGNATPAEKTRLENWWTRLMSGVRNAWQTVAISSVVKFQTITPPIKDLAMKELTESSRQKIAVAFGIPQTMLEDAASYATASEHRKQFYENTIFPECELLSVAMNEQMFKPMGLEFAFVPEQLAIMQEDENARAASLGALTTAGVPLILAMQMLGYDLPEGWDYDRLDALLNPPKPEPLTLPAPATPGEVPTPGPETVGEPGERPMAPEMLDAQRNPTPEVLRQREYMQQLGDAGLLTAPKADAASAASGTMRNPEGAAIAAMRADLKRWRRKVQAHEGKAVDFESDDIPAHIHGLIAAALPALGLEVFNFLRAAPDAREAAERIIKRIVQEGFTLHIQDVINAIMGGQTPDLAGLKGSLVGGLLTQLITIVTEEALRVAAGLGVMFDPAAVNVRAAAWARKYVYDLVTGLVDTTRDLLRTVIEQYALTPGGMTIGELTALLEPAFGEVRAGMIAVTETTRAYAEAVDEIQDMLNETGAKMVRIWQTSNDELVCPICAPLNQKPEGEWDKDFPDGPPSHVNCRCTLSLALVKP